jgi:hypothetical protein
MSGKFSVIIHKLMFRGIERFYGDMETGLTHPYHETCRAI